MNKLAFVLLMTLAVACGPSKKSASAEAGAQDGSSYANAVVIKETSETDGVGAEYKWIRAHYPGSKNKQQSLTFNNKKPYDILTIELSDGTTKDVYFDISHYFGKY